MYPAWLNRYISWSWETIARVGQTKTLRSAYLFFLVVPFAAKVMSHVPAEMDFMFGQKLVTLHLGLPFRWILLFWCAFAVTIGNVLYEIFCPDFIKRFRNWEEFRASDRGAPYLRKQWIYLFPNWGSLPAKPTGEQIRASVNNERVFQWAHPEDFFAEIEGLRPVTAATFYAIRDRYERQKPVQRRCAALSYIIGFSLLGVIALQNVVWVLEYSFR